MNTFACYNIKNIISDKLKFHWVCKFAAPIRKTISLIQYIT